MGTLVAFGYYLGARDKHSAQPQSTPTQKSQTKAPTPPKPHPKKRSKNSHSPMDFLRFGEMEDAMGEDLPDISWYEPGKKEKKTTKTQGDHPSHVSIKQGNKPRLVIIIDDISHYSQLKILKALPYHITPSIFPPSEISRESHKLAAGLKHYMVHLPMESGSAAMNRMRGMLFTRYSKAKMQARVDEIRRLFPKAKFINNHTGSVFTSNYPAMKQLYALLRKKGFVFVDSRTSAKSTVRKVARLYGDAYIARDIFIDNTQTRAYVLAQLKKAVTVAKKRGFAIVIGHPHKATMDALRHAGSILKGVQTVYIDELYR
jgi:polysaccharide deacetylase 2 family uncharacterized protein YibQ